MAEKEEGEDIEDLLMKNIYNEKDIENYTGIKIYKSLDYISTNNYYKEKFSKGIYKELFLHKKRIYSMDWLENNSNTFLVTGSSDSFIKVWDLNIALNSSGKQNSSSINPILSINTHSDIINISSRNNHEGQFISSSIDKHIKFWDIRTNLSKSNNNKLNICKFSNDKIEKDEIKHLKFNNSGNEFSFINKEGNTLFIYDFGKFEEIQHINFKSNINDLVFSNNDDQILAACEDGNVYLTNIKTNNNNNINNNIINNNNKAISGSKFPLYTIDIDKKNKYFITGGSYGILINYNIDELMSCKTYKRSDQGIRQVMYNYDDKFIATIYDGKNIDFFSTELDDHIFTIFTNNIQHFIKWNKKRNILGYVSDEKKNEDTKNKKNEEGKNISEGYAHFFIIPNL